MDANEQLIFENELCARIKQLREAKGWTQDQMAHVLMVPAERYKKYENRSPIPIYLIPRFAQLVDRSIEFVVTGKETKTLAQPERRKLKSA